MTCNLRLLLLLVAMAACGDGPGTDARDAAPPAGLGETAPGEAPGEAGAAPAGEMAAAGGRSAEAGPSSGPGGGPPRAEPPPAAPDTAVGAAARGRSIQERLDAGAAVIELGAGDYVGDIVIPEHWDGVLRGVGGWFNTRIRGDIVAPGWGRYTLEGLTVFGDVRLERMYQGVVRDVVVFGEGASFRLGTPGENRSSAVILDNLHVIQADSFRVYAADLLMLGGSIERGRSDPLFDASADFGGLVLQGVRFEHDDRWDVRVRGPHVRVTGGTHILSDLVVESGEDVAWDGLVLVLSRVVDRRR